MMWEVVIHLKCYGDGGGHRSSGNSSPYARGAIVYLPIMASAGIRPWISAIIEEVGGHSTFYGELAHI